MENPENEVADVVNLVTAAVNPEIQKIAVLKYYASDAGFSHPLCRVVPGPGSRKLILGILQLIVHLYLKPSIDDPRLLQIANHEDFYHPADVVALILPPLIPIVHLLLWLGTIASIIGARVFQTFFGFWTVRDGEGGKGVKLVDGEEHELGEKHH